MDNTGDYKANKALISRYIQKAEHFLNSNKYDEALNITNNAINIEPESSSTARAYYMRAKIFHAQEKSEDAEFDIRKAITLDPNYVIRQYTKQAENLLYIDQYDEALDVINNAIDIMPELSSTACAYCMRAKIFYAQGKTEDAEIDIRKAITLNPKDEETNTFQTRMELDTLIAKKDFDAKDYDRLLELSKRKGYLVDVGDVFYEKGYYEKAIECYTQAIECAPIEHRMEDENIW